MQLIAENTNILQLRLLVLIRRTVRGSLKILSAIKLLENIRSRASVTPTPKPHFALKSRGHSPAPRSFNTKQPVAEKCPSIECCGVLRGRHYLQGLLHEFQRGHAKANDPDLPHHSGRLGSLVRIAPAAQSQAGRGYLLDGRGQKWGVAAWHTK